MDPPAKMNETEERPSKRRRFFSENEPSSLKSTEPPPPAEQLRSGSTSSHTTTSTKTSNGSRDAIGIDSDNEDGDAALHSSAAQPENSSPSNGFDLDLFEAFTGAKLSEENICRIRVAADNDVQRAVNMYLDGSYKSLGPVPRKAMILPHMAGRPESDKQQPQRPSSSHQPDAGTARDLKTTRSPSPRTIVRSMPDVRYIGSFGVAAWATRSGTGLVKHSESVAIERQATEPKKSKARIGHANQSHDIIVRVTNSQGSEVGRLPKESAHWVSTLMDQKLCSFTGTCVYAPDRLRTNDTFFIQVRASLLHSAFATNQLLPMETNRTTGIFEEKESNDERNLRIRQFALVKLFDEVNLNPTQSNATTAKHKRQGLLQVAEAADQQQATQAPRPTPSDNPPGEEKEDPPDEGKELEQDQLDSLYKKAQSFDFGSPEAEPPQSFAMDLRPYQKQALYWMMSKERDEKLNRQEKMMHPLWEKYQWPTKDADGQDVPVVENLDHFYVNPYSGEMSLTFPEQEQHCLGGILADEMGLGKTIEMMSLIHANKSEAALKAEGSNMSDVNQLTRLPDDTSALVLAPYTTLVIAPMSLLEQWRSEAVSASKPGTVKAMVYYGGDKDVDLRALCRESNYVSAPTVLITSYGVVLSEYGKVARAQQARGGTTGLFALDFHRVILDEAHFIKNRQSKTAKACYELAAEHRWVLTGTPIVNRLEDLFSLVRFLRVEPWANFSFWKTFITVPFESKDFLRALDVVQTVLEPLVLRRTKDMKMPDGTPLVALPKKTVIIEELELSKAEREVYDFIFNRAKRTFAANLEAGTTFRNYTTIFAQILRLRQSCCHPVLTRNSEIVKDELDAGAAIDADTGFSDDMDLQELITRFSAGEQDAGRTFGAHVLQQIQAEAANECPFCCEEPMITQAVTGCWHSACKQCLLDYIQHEADKGKIASCWSCRAKLDKRDLFEVIRHDVNERSGTTTPPPVSLRRIGSDQSAKIAALTSHLKLLRRTHPATKSVVFSQFTSFLDLIAPALSRDRIPTLRFDGSMPQKARAAVLAQFRASQEPVCLLLSLRAGGVGLNLTEAKRVYMMDPWWSFAVEAQAIDRVHRMGQDEEVEVVRFVCRDSVEGRMLRIQDRKKFIASSLGMMSEEEKRVQRIEDIRELLS